MMGLFFEWYFLEVPQKIKKIWGNYLWFFSKYFAIADLAREFFWPWKGMTFAREKRGFDLGDMFSAWCGNAISRIIGAIMRSFFLAIGILCETLTVLAGMFAYVFWAAFFFLVPALFFLGIWLVPFKL